MNDKAVLFLFLWMISFAVSSDLGPWFQGCFQFLGESLDIRFSRSESPLVSCAKHCLDANVPFAGVRRGRKCTCLADTSGLERVDDSLCSKRCTGVKGLRLPCGGGDDTVWSVYTSAGPYLVNVTASVAAVWVVPDAPVTLEATAQLAGFANLTQEGGWPEFDPEDGCLGDLLFVWNVEGIPVEAKPASCSLTTCAHAPFTFILTGDFSVDVTVSNAVSSVRTRLVVTVVSPRPHGLQLLPRHSSPRHVPSCLHTHLPASPPPLSASRAGPGGGGADLADSAIADGDGNAVVAVFANASFDLEAGVGVGSGLTYVILVRDEKRGKKVRTYTVTGTDAEKSPLCVVPDCREVVQTLVFGDPGLYTVHVNVSNQYGWDQQSITVVVMERHLGDVSFSLQDGEASALPTFQTVTFYLKLVTADRHNTFLHVDFADGHVKFAPLREKKNETEMIELGVDDGADNHFGTVLRGYGDNGEQTVEQPITGLRLVASYGYGCELVVVFEHMYQTEGMYLPHVWIHNNVTETMVTQALAAPFVVQNKLSGAKIQAPAAVASGTKADFFLHLLRSSVGLHVNWQVLDKDGNILVNVTTPSTHFAKVFNETGVYSVTATAWNLLDSVQTWASVIVQKAIEDLTLKCHPSPPHLTVEDELDCDAEVSQGSHMTFTWNFQDAGVGTEVQTVNLSSHASHLYLQPGVYNVSVMATNKVSRLVADLGQAVSMDTPIRCLRMDTSGPVAPNEEVFLLATALSGTAVKFQFDFGFGWWAHYGDMEHELTRTTAVISHAYPDVGLHPVTVFAQNAISSASLTTYIVVQLPLTDLELVRQASAIANNSAVFLVRQQGKMTERQDLVFHLQFSDGTSVVSRSPVLEKNFSHGGNHTVNLTAFNEVASMSLEVHLDSATLRTLDRQPRVVHQSVATQQQPVAFYLLDKPDDSKIMEVTYSDGNWDRFTADTSRWSHVFASPGVHTAEVAIFGGGAGGAWQLGPSLRTVLVVQQPITGLRLAGPSHVGIHCYNVWQAELSGGSHLVCQWSLGGEREDRYTTTLTYTAGFGSEGVYTLGIHCHNDISSMSATLKVSVNYPVANVHLDIPVAVCGLPASIRATIYAGRHFSLLCDFGDGTVKEYLSTELKLVSVGQQLPPWQEAAPAFNATLEHVYANIGVYNVVFTVSNAVASLTHHKRAVVEEAISGITMFTDAADIVRVTDKVTVTAVVALGKNLHFDWAFSDIYHPLSVISEGNTSTATLKYDVVGEYPVMVKVSNHLQEAVTAKLPKSIIVQDPITHVTLSQLHTSGANFSLRDNRSDVVTLAVLSNGEPVTYLFDFGDGTTKKVEGHLDPFIMMRAQMSHTYDREGAFKVTVTAYNDLSNATASLAQPLYVQVPVLGPLLHLKKHCTQYGQDSVFIAQPVQGTNVTFTWRLDDETELIDAGNTVRHKYRDRGTATIQVTASNKVSSIVDFADVDVVEQIRSVDVSVDSLVVARWQPVKYTATVVPEQRGRTNRYYKWDFSRKTDLTQEPVITYTYHLSGMFNITVTAHNCHSNATSVPIKIHVVSCLVDLSIETMGDILVNQPINFSASMYQGDFLNFTWDFGDGTPPAYTNDVQVQQTFNETGEYLVTLKAENPLSRGTVTHRIFVLEHVCKPPSVSIVGLTNQPLVRSSAQCKDPWPVDQRCRCANEKKTNQHSFVRQWQVLRVESQVSVNCNITSDLTYTWLLSRQGQPMDQRWHQTGWGSSLGLDEELMHHPILMLPPHTLPVGRYLLTLKVSMNDTEIPVYQLAEVQIMVEKSPLESIIQGGVLRRFSRQDEITLDGSMSHDPDNGSAVLSFQWGCHLLKHPDQSCFNSTIHTLLPSLNTSELRFPGLWLSPDHQEFLFNLTVTSPGMAPAVTTQAITVTPLQQVIPVAVECRQCHRQWVNANNKVSLVAQCLGDACFDRRLHYNWQVFVVPAGNPDDDSDDSTDAHSACVAADGSSYLRQVLASTTTTVNPVTTTTVTTTSTKAPTTTTLSVLSGSRILPGDASPPTFLVPPWQNLQENPGPKSRTETYLRGQLRFPGRVPPDFYPEPSESQSGSQRLSLDGPPYDIKEGVAGDSGSSQGRSLVGGFHEPREQPGDARDIQSGLGKPGALPTEAPSCVEGDFNCKRFEEIRPVPPHITMQPHYPWALNPNQMASDPNGPSLVLRPGTLKQGWTYLVQVTVSSPDWPEAEGEAMTYFRVNKSPRKGACSVRPKSGVEMETLFKVFCREWRDEQLPLWYEVSYSLDGEELDADTSQPRHQPFYTSSSHHYRHVIYRGLSHEITFRLPAGLSSNGHKVLLHLAIQDDWGASTTICHIPTHVTPQPTNATTTVSETVLDHEAEAISTYLANAVYRGDVTGTQDSCEVLCHLATLLNRLPIASSDGNITKTTLHQLRAEVRARLVQALQAFPMRDEVELMRTLHCLLQSTKIVSQIDGAVLVKSIQLLESIRTRLAVVYTGQNSVSSDLVSQAVQVVSNLIQASTRGPLLKGLSEDARRRQTQRAVNVVNDLLMLSLHDHTLGETPVRHSADFITLVASHYHSRYPASINVSTTSFKLPVNMTPVLKASVKNWNGSGREESECFQARAAAFQQNPYTYREDQLAEIQSEVVSLEMFTCSGDQRLVVRDLQPDNSVEITIPLTTSVETDGEYQMARSQMSIHHFNISQSQEDLYLTLLVNLSVIPPGQRPFPVTALISQTWPPHPQHNLFRRDFPLDAQELRIFFPPGSVKGAGSYYLGLIETSLNSGRHRKTEVSMRNYTLSAWFGSCLFWNETIKHWSSKGCQVTDTTTTIATHCRCSHLTAFGSHVELIPNELSFTDLEHFFSPHENPVVIILVSTVMLLYMSLLVLVRRADTHNMRKGGMVCLADNNVSDTQLYEIIVDTGLCQSASTTAKISIILHGEYGMSETRELISDDDRPMFERNSRDHFLLTLPDSLGRIVKVQLWHNNAGASPRWFLGQVLVRDLNTGKATYFLCDKWFSVDEGDGRVERELVAVDNITFSQILVKKGREYIADFHLWTSVFTCPPHTRFTRAQRLTCCLTLLLSYMALSAMWYHREPEQRRGEFGLLDLSWRSLTVGAICCVILFPLHLFLTFLFRRSRVSHSPCDHKVDASSRSVSASNPTTTHTSAGEGVGGLGTGSGDTTDTLTTYSLLDQSILNWQSIQDWAQRQWVKRQQSTRSSANSVKNNAQPATQPCPTQPVQHTLHAGDETDQASSGFEDAVSQATAERNRIKAASDSSSEGRRSHSGDSDGGSRKIFLPSWCRYVAWVLCALISTTSATVTILYGFRFGPVKSIFWLQSLYFSFMVCVFLAQPLWILVTVLWVAVWNRNNLAVLDHSDHDGEVRDAIEYWHNHQKQLLENSEEGTEMEKGVRARQRSRYLRFARPPQEKSLQESRKKLMKEKNAVNFLREVIAFVFMFTLVCIMAYGKDLAPLYQLNKSLDTLLLRGGEQDFRTINSVEDWHRWAQTTLLDAVYGMHSTPGLFMKAGEAQENNVMVGHPHLRQLRAPPQYCQAIPYISHKASCHHTHNSHSGDTEDDDSYVWSDAPPGGSVIWGQQGSYDAGGYAVPLSYSSKGEARSALKQMKLDSWIDSKTRAVILEITVLHVPTNLFSAVQLLLELPPSGGAFPLPKITSTFLFRYVTAWDNCMLACELLFVLLAMVRTQGELTAIVQQGYSYFTWPWNYTQVLMVVTSLSYVACYIYRFVLVSEAVEFLRSRFYEQFISLAFLASWDELLRSLVGLLVFLVLMTQGLQLTRYCPHLAKFTAVYRRARREIMLLMLLFVVIIMAFSSLGSALFASVSFSMRSLWSSALTFTALSTGIYTNPDLLGDGLPWFDVLALVFSIFGAGLLTAYMVAVLTHRLRVYKSSDVLVMGKCELLDFSLQRLLLLVGVRKLTPVHEPEADLPPECTLAEFEYQVEELLFRMNALAGTTNLPEKPAGYLTDSDQSQAIGDDGISSGGSEPQVERSGAVHIEGEGRLEQRVQKIEDKLYANEPYLAQLLKLDSIGADVLSQEKEKQLRSHLEMEIFRQLQMRRQENGDPTIAFDTSMSPMANTVSTCTASKPGFTLMAPQLPYHDLTGGDASHQHKTQAGLKGNSNAAVKSGGTAAESSKLHHRQTGHKRDDHAGAKKQAPSLDPGQPPPALYCSASDESPGSETTCLLSSGDDLECCKIMPHKSGTKQTKGAGGLGGLSVITTPFDTVGNYDNGHMHKHHAFDCGEGVTTMQRTDSVRGSSKHHPADAGPLGMGRSSSLRTAGRKHAADLPASMERADSLHAVGKRHATDSTALDMERADSVRLSSKKHHGDLTSHGMERSDSVRGSSKKHTTDPSALGMERSDSLRLANKKHLPDLTPSCMERSDSLRSAGRKPELPPKPTFAQSVLPLLESRRSPKPPPLKIPTERVLHRVDAGMGPGAGSWTWRGDTAGSGQLGESSSGSEPDTVFTGGAGITGGSSRRLQGQGKRNLRKTKSRGKGKEAGTLTPTLLLDELSFTVHEPPKDLQEPEDIVTEQSSHPHQQI